MGMASMATTPIEIELAFFMGTLNISVKIGITTTPPPNPERADIVPVIIPMIGKYCRPFMKFLHYCPTKLK